MPTPWKRDLEADRRKLTAWLATQLPQGASPRLSELTTPTASGFSNDTIMCEVTWREAGRSRWRLRPRLTHNCAATADRCARLPSAPTG